MAAIIIYDSLKMIRETLCLAQYALSATFENNTTHHRERLQRLINDIDRQRPLNSAGKHGENHTLTCGCEDK